MSSFERKSGVKPPRAKAVTGHRTPKKDLHPEYVIPSVFDKRVGEAVFSDRRSFFGKVMCQNKNNNADPSRVGGQVVVARSGVTRETRLPPATFFHAFGVRTLLLPQVQEPTRYREAVLTSLPTA
ncbi:MAG: hypothetical protein ACRD9S_21535 [Pyrinomonadaceae bacterium]